MSLEINSLDDLNNVDTFNTSSGLVILSEKHKDNLKFIPKEYRRPIPLKGLTLAVIPVAVTLDLIIAIHPKQYLFICHRANLEEELYHNPKAKCLTPKVNKPKKVSKKVKQLAKFLGTLNDEQLSRLSIITRESEKPSRE